MNLQQEYQEALKNLQIAHTNYNMIDAKDFSAIDIAIADINVAEMRLDKIMHEIKNNRRSA